ncbi:MAG: hypothetical protein ACFCA4_12650 [Cyanophyceae cyanobacterium]
MAGVSGEGFADRKTTSMFRVRGPEHVATSVDISGADPATNIPKDIPYQIGSKNESVAWINPTMTGDIVIHEIVGPSGNDPSKMLDRTSGEYFTAEGLGRAIVFDFDPKGEGRRILPDGCFFQHGRENRFRRIRSFSIYGSNGTDVDNTTSQLLVMVDDSGFLSEAAFGWSEYTALAPPSEPVRFIEIHMDGPNTSGLLQIYCSGFLVGGQIFPGSQGY